jgi:hypothetical protein
MLRPTPRSLNAHAVEQRGFRALVHEIGIRTPRLPHIKVWTTREGARSVEESVVTHALVQTLHCRAAAWV